MTTFHKLRFAELILYSDNIVIATWLPLEGKLSAKLTDEVFLG